MLPCMASILNQRSVDIWIRSGLDFSKASWWFDSLCYCTCLWTKTNLEAFGKASALTWDQPVLPPLRSVWRVLTLVWSLRCPLLLGVGSAWRRRTGDALVNHWQYYLLPLLLKVLLLWMTLSLTLESVGCRAQNEYINTRCRIRPGQRSFIYLC